MKSVKILVFAVLVSCCCSSSLFAKEWKRVRIAVEGAYPPFSYVQPDGELAGFDIDMARALCAAMDVQCKLVMQDWDGMIPGLLARKYDAIIASMSITEERKKKVDFTNKYYQTPAKFIAPKGAFVNFSDESLKGKIVGVQRETIHDKYLSARYGNDITIKRYGNLDEGYLDLVSGRLDLIIADSAALYDGFLTKDAGAGYEFVGPDLVDKKWFGEGVGVVVRKGEKELAEKFNQAIDALRASGEYTRIQDKYFNFNVYGE